MNSSDGDQLPAIDLTSKLGPARRRTSTLLSVPRSRNKRQPIPSIDTDTAEVVSEPARQAEPGPATPRTRAEPAKPARRRAKDPAGQVPVRESAGEWASQTVSGISRPVFDALTAEAKRRGVAKHSVAMLAVRTHLDEALDELEAARLEVRAPHMPAVAGSDADNVPTVRLMLRIRASEREEIRNKVESRLNYWGALTDAYQWCLHAWLSQNT